MKPPHANRLSWTLAGVLLSIGTLAPPADADRRGPWGIVGFGYVKSHGRDGQAQGD